MAVLRSFEKAAVSVPDAVLDAVLSLKSRLLRLDGVVRVALFGSYSKGTYHANSDIDLAVFTENTACQSLLFRRALAVAASYDFDIQILLFPISSLEDPCGIVEEVVTFGHDLTDA